MEMKNRILLILGVVTTFLVVAGFTGGWDSMRRFLADPHTWGGKQTFSSGIGFGDGTSQTTAGGSGAASPAGPSGSLQYNAAGTLNGTAMEIVSANSSGVTSIFRMSTTGTTIEATNWQGFAKVEYYPGGTTRYLVDAGATRYYPDGSVEWDSYGGTRTSYIDISGYISGNYVVAGVSKTNWFQVDTSGAGFTNVYSGVSISKSMLGSLYEHEGRLGVGAGCSILQLPIIPASSTGATMFFVADDVWGSGLTVFSGTSTQPIRIGTAEFVGAWNPAASGVTNGRITFWAKNVLGGTSLYWSTKGSDTTVSGFQLRSAGW